jgi:putative Holliday junction resolvase
MIANLRGRYKAACYPFDMRALGLDVGSKTIGIALSDETGLVATPLETLARRGTREDVARLAALAREHDAQVLVVGLPLELDGSIGLRARRVEVLCEALRGAGLAVETWDERFSTVAAERVLLEADLSRRRRKEVVDKVAAAYILQGWLDSRRAGPSETT